MPTSLPNGVVIYNATPHDLYFSWNEEEVIVAPSDTVINAKAQDKDVETHEEYTLTTVEFKALAVGKTHIEWIRKNFPDALIVGSIIAAQAYKGDVIAPIPLMQDRKTGNRKHRLVRSDRFTVYLKEKENNG